MQLQYALREQIGVFNYLEVVLPPLAYVLWGALAVALGVTALLVGTRRERPRSPIGVNPGREDPIRGWSETRRSNAFDA
jgi:hypothetical protein